MITQENVNHMLKLCIEKIKSCNIPISQSISQEVIINKRAKKRLGCCIYKNKIHYIEISVMLLVDTPVSKKYTNMELLEQTLCHELLHTCRGCRNHGAKWKEYAAILNACYGYDIERTVSMDLIYSSENVSIRTESVRYVLLCQNCGLEIKRSRMSKPVKYPYKYRCKCGGKLNRIQ